MAPTRRNKRRNPRVVVSFSGLDGSGKSSQARLLREALAARGVEAVIEWTRLPYSPSLDVIGKPVKRLFRVAAEARPRAVGDETGPSDPARRVRQKSAALTHLWTVVVATANAMAHRRTTTRHLRAGKVVIRDRYVLDSIVHLHHRYGTEHRFRVQRWLIRAISPAPLVAYLVDTPPDVAYGRKEEKKFPLEDLEIQSAMYRENARPLKVGRLDGERPPSELHGRILEDVWAALGGGEDELGPDVPPIVATEIERLKDRFGRVVAVIPRKPPHPWLAFTESRVAYLVEGPESEARVRHEAELLEWATARGLPTPEIVELSNSWLVTERVPTDPPTGPAYVDAAVAFTDALLKSEPPPVTGVVPSRRTSRRGLPTRLLRQAISPVPRREFVRLRAAVSRLSRDALSHGDFHPKNVLFDAVAGKVNVIDWRHLGYLPRQTDLLHLWTQLWDAEDRDRVFQAVLEREPDRRHLAILHHWLALRAVVELVIRRPLGGWDTAKVRRSKQILDEARKNAEALLA